jgi:ribose transport system permease protein
LSKNIQLQRLAADYLGLIVVLILLVGLFGTLSEHFLSVSALTTLANQIPELTVIAVGMTFVLLIAGIDLSVGSVLALSAAVLATSLAEWAIPLPLALLLGIGAGLLCGFANGFISVKWGIPSFIVTLGMLEIARGGAYLVTDSRTVFIGGDAGKALGLIAAPINSIGLSSAFFLAIFIVIAAQVVLSFTSFGRHIMAIGANEQAARLSGLNPKPIKIIVFVSSGLLASLGGIFQCSRMVTGDPNGAIGMELSAIAAVVIGGTSLMGGRGSVVSSFLGVLIIAVLQTGLAHIGASEPEKRLVTGGVIVVAVIVDAYRHKLAARR